MLLNLSHTLLQLTTLVAPTWDAGYVTNQLVLPVAPYTQDMLYCVCHECRGQQLDDLLKGIQEVVTNPQLVLTNRADFELRHGNHKRASMTIVVAKSLQDYALQVMDRVLRGRHFYINLVIVQDALANLAEVEQWLRFLSRKRFVNADLYYRNRTNGRNEVFGHSYYPVFTMHNKSHLVGNFLKFYSNLVNRTNLQGYKVHTPLMQDPPKVIRIGRGNKIKGTAYSVMQLFLDYVNSSMEENQLRDASESNVIADNFVDMRRILEMVRSEQIEITPHAYALFHADEHIDQSYPVMVVNWCLMVPIENSVSTMYYPLQPFESKIWYALIGTFSAWLGFQYLWHSRHHLRQTNFILQHLCRFLSICPPTDHYQVLTLREFLLSACLYFHGFFFSVMYTSMLGSFLTVNIFHEQINTLADLLRTKLPVMIIDYELEFLLSSTELSAEFSRHLHVTNSTNFYLHQFAFNTSYAYFATEDVWHFLDLQQRYLKQRRFKYTDICFGSYHQAFPMQLDSPLWRELEYFLYRVHSSGLLHHFESKAFGYAIEAGLLRRLMSINEFESVGMAHLKIIFALLVVMLGVSCMSFLLEMYGERLRVGLGRWKLRRRVTGD